MEKTPPTRPPRRRVTNDLGVLASGHPGNRVIMLVNQRELRKLAATASILREAPRRALLIIVGLVEMTVDGHIYRAETLSHIPGYRHMLRAIASSFAREEQATFISAHGVTSRVRDYGPIQGLRRRGDGAYRKLMKAARVTREQADEIMAAIMRAYRSKVPRDLS